MRLSAGEPVKENAFYVASHGWYEVATDFIPEIRPTPPWKCGQRMMLNNGQLSAVAHDRCSWRTLVVACTAAEGGIYLKNKSMKKKLI